MKLLVLAALIAIIAPPNVSTFDASSAQMVKAYSVARTAMLDALTPPHKQLLASIATAGFVLIHTAMNLGPMTMNAMIVHR